MFYDVSCVSFVCWRWLFTPLSVHQPAFPLDHTSKDCVHTSYPESSVIDLPSLGKGCWSPRATALHFWWSVLFVPQPHECDVIEAHHDGRFLLSTAVVLFTGWAAKEGSCNISRGWCSGCNSTCQVIRGSWWGSCGAEENWSGWRHRVPAVTITTSGVPTSRTKYTT